MQRYAAFMAMSALALSGCATFNPATADEALHGIQTGNEFIYEVRKVPLNKACRQEAAACKGKVDKPEECLGWVKCDAMRSLLDQGQSKISQGLVDTKTAIGTAQAAGWLSDKE